VLNENGSYSFDPTDSAYDNLNVGDETVLTIPVTVTDEHGASDTAQIQITVTGTNDAPVAGSNVTTSVEEGSSSISGQLTSTDLDDDATAAFTITEGTVAPAGFVLNENGSYSFDPTDSAYDNLNVGDETVLTIPVTVTDEHGATDTAQIQITVTGTNDAPVAGVNITANVDEGSASISGQLTSTDLDDGATVSFAVSEGTDAPGGFVLNTDGSYSFDPADSAYDHLNVGDSTVLIIPVTVTDDNGATDTSQIQITIQGTSDAPIAGVNITANVDEGAATITGQLSSTDIDDGATASFAVSDGATAPDGFVLNADGLYSFDPSDNAYDHLNVGDSTVLTIPVTVTDDNGATDTSQIQITVQGTNDIPTVVAETTTVTEDSTISGTIQANDIDGDNLTFSISEGAEAPEGLVVNADGSYTFDANAYDSLDAGETTTIEVPITVNDGHGGTSETTLTIDVNGINNDLSYVSETAGYSNVLGFYELDADGKPAGEASVVIDNQNGMQGGTHLSDLNPDTEYGFFIIANGANEINETSVVTFDTSDEIPVLLIDGQAASNPVYHDTPTFNTDGKDHFVFESDGSGGTNINIEDLPNLGDADFRDVVLNVNFEIADKIGNDTQARNDSATTDEDSSITIDVLANDKDGTGDNLTIASVQNPVTHNGVEVGNAEIVDGKIVFTPNDALDSLGEGETQNISFSYSVSDGTLGEDTASVNLTITGTNDAPVVSVDVTALNEDTATVIATASDVDGTISLTDSSASHGSLSMDADGSISYTPNQDYNGTDTVSISVTDNQGAETTQTINLTIDATNDNPVAIDDTGSTIAAATVLVSDAFDSNNDWGGNVSDGEMALTRGDTDASNTFSFGIENAGNTVSISFDAQAQGSWDNSGRHEDTFTVNGEEITLDRGASSQTFTVEATADVNGEVAIVFDSVITGGDESVVVDNLVVSTVGDDWTSNVIETNEGQPITINAASLLSNDSDTDGDSLSIVSVQDAQHGSVSLDSEGNVLFIPDEGYSGVANFTYTISDNNGGTDTASVTLQVVEVDNEASAPILNISIGDAEVVTNPDTNTNPNPVGHWKLDDSNSGGFEDSSGNGHTAENHAENNDDDQSGRFGRGIEIENNDYIEVAHSTDLKPDSGTFTMWFDPDNNNGTYGLASTDSSSYDDGGHFTLTMNGGELRLRMQDEDTSYHANGGDVQSGWNQVTVSWGDSGMHVYLNGSEVASNSYTGGLSGNENPWVFGANQWISGDNVANNLQHHFDGDMDEIAIFGEQLGSEQIAELYTNNVETFAGATAPTSGVVLVSESFENGATDWTNNTVTETSGELGDFLGRFGGTDGEEGVSKVFDFGVEHAGQTVTIEFDMYEIDSWDAGNYHGDNGVTEAFQVFVNGDQVSSDVMSAFGSSDTADGGTKTTSNEFTGWGQEEIHHYSIQATVDENGEVQLGFGTTLQQSISDESCGIDNVIISSGDDWSGADIVSYSYPITINASLSDTDGSETLSNITIANLPDGASLSAGTENGDGSWSLTQDDLSELGLQVASGIADFSLEVSVSSTESNGNVSATSTASQTVAEIIVDKNLSYNNANDLPDVLTTGSGNDSIQIDGDVTSTINTNAGNDSVVIGDDLEDDASINTGDGNDRVTVADDVKHDSSINTGDGNDSVTITNNLQNDASINTGSGHDAITIGDKLKDDSTINAGEGNDNIHINRIEGDAIINAGSGNDSLILDDVSSSFDDGSVNLGAGNDVLIINDSLSGTDAIFDGGDGIDSLMLNDVSRSNWDDGVKDNFSNFENVTFEDGSVLDLTGSSVAGTSGNDDLSGGTGDDVLLGMQGDDVLVGQDGNDVLNGGAGDDRLEGGGGDDQLIGGDGNDSYIANPFDGADSFSGGEGGGWTDVIDISAVVANDPDSPWSVEVDGEQLEYDIAASALELNPDTAGVITFGDGSELSFNGVERIEW